jgi:hypothetical protein
MDEIEKYPNYFESQEETFKKHLSHFSDKEVLFLQIGVYMGHASKYLLENILTNNNAKLFDVDAWGGETGLVGENQEAHEKFNWESIEKHYDEKFKDYFGNKLVKYKGTSDSFFEKNTEYFDFIYIDGNHQFEHVLKDANNAIKFLKGDGIISFDDYGGLSEIRKVVDEITNNNNNFKIIEKGWQLWIKRV